jgi:C1A family cysteine protease
MRQNEKRVICADIKTNLAAFVVAAVLLLPLATLAQEEPSPTLAPVNPAFLIYQEEARAGLWESPQWDEFGLGFIPSPMDWSHLKTREILNPIGTLAFPASYDLRTYGKVTAVRNQGNCGSCWAFGCMASLESFLLNGETRDFSENNLKDKAGFDKTCCDGGNAHMSTAYFARWDGPANETDDQYAYPSCTSPPSVPIQKHVQDVIYIPGRSSDVDNDGIKQAVMTYGAVTISMNWVDDQWNKTSYWNPSPYWAYYYNGSLTTNHMVAVVGWDDNYAASNFSTTPPGNGAFLIKNSWGTGWGNSGYFWISYYDTCAARYDSAVFTGESPVDYSAVYQYDPLGQTSALGYGAGVPAWCANMFTASASQSLVAASTYFLANNTAYELYVYTGCSASAPRSGTLVATKSGTIVNAGYRTIMLDSPV